MAERFAIEDTPLAGLKQMVRTVHGDERGFLSRFYCARELAEAGFAEAIVQINHTLTRKAGSIRGMHFQHPPHAEDKFVSVVAGAVFDVAVDLRAGSPTFLQWYGVELSTANRRSLFIPKGFAHGFQTLKPDCELIYLHTQFYAPESEGGLNPLDPRLQIAWPLPTAEMSPRDRGHPMLTDGFTGTTL